MSIQITPTPAQAAAIRLDSSLAEGLQRMQRFVANAEKILTTSTAPDGTKLTQDQIIAAGGDRYANLLPLIAAVKSTVNIGWPGTYPD
jgi:hypothetical protein